MTPQGTIYLDMDGTIVDFISGANQILKQPWNSSMTKEHRQARNKRIFEDGGVQFWINLRPLPDFHLLWDFVKPFSPHILSAVPHGVETGYLDKKAATNACEGKWDWVKRHCPSIPHEHFHCVLREHKRDYATKIEHGHIVPNVLVDDLLQNVVDFKANRGIGILHKDALSTINSLYALGYHH